MLKRIVHFSLRFRGAVVALACLVIGYGLFVTDHAKLDVFPDFVPPEVIVQTEARGFVPEQVEALVTRPIEFGINGLVNLASMRSESLSGLSVITVVFKEGTDVLVARQMLAERLAEAVGDLPEGVKLPTMSPLTSSTMDLLKIGLVSDKLSPMELRTLADRTVQPWLLSVPGVAHCIVYGGEVRELQIQVHPDRLTNYDLSISDVLIASRASLGMRVRSPMSLGLGEDSAFAPARASSGVMGAGFVENSKQRILIQTEGQSLTAEVLGEITVGQHDGMPVRVKDVASVREGPDPKVGDALIQNHPGVLLALSGQHGANTMEVTRAVDEALDELKPLFAKEGVTVYPRLHRPATFIENSLHNVEHSLLLGGVLVAIVLFLFLGHFRTAFISLTAIPLSLLTAIIILDKLGVSLNTITLGGLAIAIGEVVDDAIIDVENIFRRLRENHASAQPRSVFRVVLDASLEVRSAVVYATFIVALIFLPVLTMTGLQGNFFAPLALSYILAIMASLGVALTVTPALSLLFFSRGVRGLSESRLQAWLKSVYRGSLNLFARRPRTILLGVLCICAAAVWSLPNLGSEFLPEFREGHFVLHVEALPGTSIPEMLRLGDEISTKLRADTNIATVEQQVGRAERSEDTWEPNRCEFHVELKEGISGSRQAEMMGEIREMLDKIPGIQSQVVTFLGDRISESISGEYAPVVVSVYGHDLDVIDGKAKEIAQVLSTVPGAGKVQLKSPPGTPRMAVRLRSGRLAETGFRSVEILEAIQAAYQGAAMAQVQEGNWLVDVAVILDEASRQDAEGIASLVLRNEQGRSLPLKAVADVQLTSGRYSIMHDGASRRQVVTCAPRGRDVTSFVADAKKKIDGIEFPKGVYAAFTGTAEQAKKAQRQLLMNSAIAGAGILLLLIVVTGNWRNLMLILANVPFALVGGVLAVWLTGLLRGPEQGALTIGSLVGFVTLFGITMRNSIMMISHFEHLVNEEGMTWGPDAAFRGATERVIPILMTALVTALGLLPLAMGAGEAGREIEGPMAIVILGGLITSTALNLLVLPTLALRFGRFAKAAPDEQ